MLKNLYKMGCFDYDKFILKNLKKLSLSPDEAVVLIELLSETKVSDSFSISQMEKIILLKREEIENILASLLERGFYKIYLTKKDGLDVENVSFDGFFLKASSILSYSDENKGDELLKVNEYLEEILNRLLSSNELDIIKSLVEDDYYTLDNFKDSVKRLSKRKNITFKLIVSYLNNNIEDKKETPEFVLEFLDKLKNHE